MSINNFAGILSHQLMDYGRYLRRMESQGLNSFVFNHTTERDEALRNLTVPFYSETAGASPSSSTSTTTATPTMNSTSGSSIASPSISVGYASLPTNNSKELIDVDNMNDEMVAGEQNEDPIDIGMIIKKYHDIIGTKHWVAKYSKTVSPRSGKRYTMARKCSACGKHTCCFCYQCGVPLCFSINNIGATHSRKCFTDHVKEHCRKSTRLTQDDSELIG